MRNFSQSMGLETAKSLCLWKAQAITDVTLRLPISGGSPATLSKASWLICLIPGRGPQPQCGHAKDKDLLIEPTSVPKVRHALA
jgi:hypothetical protein